MDSSLYSNAIDPEPTLKSLLAVDFDKYKMMAEHAISVYNHSSKMELCDYFCKNFTETDFYIPEGSVVLQPNSRVGNQLFQYAAAYSLAKQTESQLYILIDPHATHYNDMNYLDDFNIPQEYFIYKNQLNQQYWKIFYPLTAYQNSPSDSVRILEKYFKTIYVDTFNFFDLTSKKNDQILVMNSYFQNPIFFQSVKDDILEQFKFKNIDSNQFQSTIGKLESRNSVCIHLRKTDANQCLAVFTHIEFHKQAINLSKSLLDNPKFFIFSDDINKAQDELNDFHDIEYIQHSPIEDLYLMNHCYNNIISRGTFSWWAASLNMTHEGFVIAPYMTTPDIVYKYYPLPGGLKLAWKFMADSHYPEDWILLDESKFDLYTGKKQPLDLCPGYGNFSANLCYASNKDQVNVNPKIYIGNKNIRDFCNFGWNPSFCYS